jgi:4-carboxymuconolactone decarboxylase
MARLPNPEQQDMAPEAQAIWSRIAASRGAVRGPFAVLLQVPELADRVAEIGDYLRFHGLFDGADRELAILAAAREVEARYEWQAHAPIARKEGAREESISAVREKGPTDSLNLRERNIIEIVRALNRDNAIPDGLFQQALADLGEERLVELVALAGYYRLIGFVLNGFEVDLPENAGPTF